MTTRARTTASAMSRRVAAIPSTPGIRRVHEHDIWPSAATWAAAWSPSAASPTTCRSGSISRIIRKPARTSAWSSTIRTPIEDAEPASTALMSGSKGSVATSSKPPSGLTRATSEPPYTATRSRIPRSPLPASVAGVEPAGYLTVVAHSQLDPVLAVVDRHFGVPWIPRMPQGVREPLLHKPVTP